jgi:hypothetical protein
MPLTKPQKDKLKKDVETLWATSPAKALKLLVKLAQFKSKIKKT